MSTFTSPSPSLIKLISLLAPLISLTTSTSIISFSTLQFPVLLSTLTRTSSPSIPLKQLRPFFEGGRYVFPPASIISASLFSYLAYAHPSCNSSFSPLTTTTGTSTTTIGSGAMAISVRTGFVLAALGCISIIPFTAMYMIPVTNNRILELDDRAKASKDGEDAVDGKGKGSKEGNQEEVAELFKMFIRQNLVRGGMMWLGGAIGLWTILNA